jgi:hypothetical protein
MPSSTGYRGEAKSRWRIFARQIIGKVSPTLCATKSSWESERHRPGLAANGFIGSEPRHPALRAIIRATSRMDTRVWRRAGQRRAAEQPDLRSTCMGHNTRFLLATATPCGEFRNDDRRPRPPTRRRTQQELLLSGLGVRPAKAGVGCYALCAPSHANRRVSAHSGNAPSRREKKAMQPVYRAEEKSFFLRSALLGLKFIRPVPFKIPSVTSPAFHM